VSSLPRPSRNARWSLFPNVLGTFVALRREANVDTKTALAYCARGGVDT
jgi:hypothetical protein